MKKSVCYTLTLLALFAISTAVAQPDGVPRAFAERLAHGGELVVGTLPEGFDLPLPPESTVLGAVVYEHDGMTVFLDVALSAADIGAFFNENLLAAGWQFHEEGTLHRPIFVVAPETNLMFCSDERGYFSVLMEPTAATEVQDVRLFWRPDDRHTPCTVQPGMQDDRIIRTLPQLVAPAGAQIRGGGSGGGGDTLQTSVSIVTDLESDALLEHYAAQLESDMWQRVSEGEDFVFFRYMGEEGFNGILAVREDGSVQRVVLNVF